MADSKITKQELEQKVRELTEENKQLKEELNRLRAKHENIIGLGGIRNDYVK